LAEVVCESIYLCPRLSRDQIIAAIEGPARVFGGKLEPALIARIANDMGTDPDQLPLMQHALMRLWEDALLRDRTAPLLRLDDYVVAAGSRPACRAMQTRSYRKSLWARLSVPVSLATYSAS
jgi:hypothetical protein